MNIESTENEKYEEIKDKYINIVSWDKTKEMGLYDPKQSISSRFLEYARNNLKLFDHKIKMQNLDHTVKFNKRSLNDSIANMCRQKSDLKNLAKLFTVLDAVSGNAVLIDVESYNHPDRNEAKLVDCMYQYLSGFCDEDYIYPVKITVEERKQISDSYLHMVVTVGLIKKEALPNVRVHSDNKSDESLSNRVTSFLISIQDFVKYFNRDERIILQNIPDNLLSDYQKKIKQNVIKNDEIRKNKQQQINEKIKELVKEKQRLEYEEIIDDELDEVNKNITEKEEIKIGKEPSNKESNKQKGTER